MPKLTVAQREQVKLWIKLCKVQRFSNEETTNFVNSNLPDGITITEKLIEYYITELKAESRNWITKISLDVYEYAEQLKLAWDTINELMHIQWQELQIARKNHDVDTLAKTSLLICKLNEQLLEMVGLFPQIALPNPASYPISNNMLPTKITSKPILDAEDVGNGHDNEVCIKDVP